jgi:tetratricopeptide (TPR) repeat protein
MRDSATASASIAMTYYQQNNFESAIDNFQQSLKYDSTYYEAMVGMGLTYRRMRDTVQSEQWFRKAIKTDPKQSKAYQGLGDLLAVVNRLDDALKIYQEGLTYDSSTVALYTGEADVLERLNRLPEEETVLRTAVQRFPDDMNQPRNLSDFLFKHDRYVESEQVLLPLVAKYPKMADLRQRLADSYIQDKKNDAALAQLDTVLADDPKDQETMRRKGALLVRMNRMQSAISIFNMLIQQDSTRASYRTDFGEALSAAANYSGAEAQYQKALALQPGMARALFDLGDLNAHLGDVKRGQRLYQTPKANLFDARASYQSARDYYQKAAAADQDFANDVKVRIDYLETSLAAIAKELKARHVE